MVVLPLFIPEVPVLPSRCMRSVDVVPMLLLVPVPVAVESWVRCVEVPEVPDVPVVDGFVIDPSRCVVPVVLELPV